ncbi:NAD(P)/FAD-dependent oxidoreductase [Nocardia sp. NPDC001965]
MTSQRIRVVVVGGGYAGTVAANRLQRDPEIDITLINPRPEFVQRLRLHQFAAGSGEATADYGTLLGNRVRLVVDSVTRIDTGQRKVRMTAGDDLDYDYVVYAVGSTAAVPGSVPGATEFAYPIAELEHARTLRNALAAVTAPAPVTVVGGGLTGVETAAELAEQGWTVTLVCGGCPVPSFSEPARRSVVKWLTENGVAVLETELVTEVRSDAVVLGGGVVRPSAVTVWTAGFGVPALAAASGLRTDALGRMLTDETLTSVDDDRVVAAGDAVVPSGRPLRMSCYTAGPTGATAADTVLSRIAGDRPAPLELAYLASNVGLGRRAARFQLTRKDDSPVHIYLGGRIGGRLAGAIKEAVTKGTLWGIRREARKPGCSVWFTGGNTRSRQLASEPAAVVRS